MMWTGDAKTNKQTDMWQQKRKRQRPRRLVRMMVFALPMTALLFAGWISLSGDATAGNHAVAPKEPHNPYISITGTPSRSELKTASSTSESDGDNWQLLLINPWNSLPDGYEVTLTQLKNGQAVDKRCYPDLQQMMDDCRAAGLQPLICSSYRTLDYQQKLFDNKVNNLIAQGYTADAAREKAATSIAVPGTSEHHTGLALDIVDINNQNLDSAQENTPVQQWLMENSWQYGFILRYPSEKTDITGIIYEPWHYRYVGKEIAKEIMDSGFCFEEYLAEREND